MSIKKSLYDELLLESNDQSRTIDLVGGAILFEYYEDIFSPTITAKIKVIDNGNVISPADNQDGDRQSIYNGLPLRGGERLSLKIAGNSSTNPGLDFSKKVDDYFYVSSITDVISETNRETFTLHLVSREAVTNETSRVTKKYTSSIDQSVSSIIQNILQANKVGTIDQTSNKYSFIGNLRKPFTVLTWLASKSAPVVEGGSGTAGFFFYQTVDGFQFRSIDLLNKQPVKATFIYSEATESYDTDDKKNNNDFKILNYNIERNQNLIEKLRLGTYANVRYFFNPLTGGITDPGKIKFRQNDYRGKVTNLGREEIKLPKLNNNSTETLGDVPTRIITSILDIGTMNRGVSREKNADPTEYQSQTLLRYNELFRQTFNVIVPSNTNLRAGDIIECLFPKITRNPAREYDEDQSGLYMIKELCHHFDARNSYTSLKLVRDTFGIKK